MIGTFGHDPREDRDRNPFNASLDRIIPAFEGGKYTLRPLNVQWVSAAAVAVAVVAAALIPAALLTHSSFHRIRSSTRYATLSGYATP